MKNIYIVLIFCLVAIPAVAQQTSLASLRASAKNTAVQINWVALTESNMTSHTIERSSNGSAFTPIGTLPARNLTTPGKYEFEDAAPVQGTNYYRIRSLSNTGSETLSGIISINMGAIRTGIGVVPNPVRNGIINLQLNNLEKGRYAINIFNVQGQQVFTYSMDHPGGSSTEVINLPGNVGKGTHFLQLTNGLTRMNKQLLFQ